MEILAAAEVVLLEAGGPRHYREITKRMVRSGRYKPRGQTPERSVNSALTKDMRRADSRFRRVDSGVYDLAERLPTLPSHAATTAVDAGPEPLAGASMTFLDAAERVLRESALPLSYREISARALSAGLIQTESATPANTLTAQVGADIRRRQDRGERPRFVRPARGLIGLAAELPTGLASSIDSQNCEVRRQLLKRIHARGWEEFEVLIGDLLETTGFRDVQRTPGSRDQGVDVRATVVVANVMPIRIAVQAKCQKANVQAPTVQRLRGSLRPHERGLIITTSDFSPGARSEAERPDAFPVALMNGEELAVLLAANEIGVKREAFTLFTLDAPTPTK